MNIREEKDRFSRRHIGPRTAEIEEMLSYLGVSSLEELIDSAVPGNIRTQTPLQLGEPLSEHEMLKEARLLAARNQKFRSFIGMGYSETITPPVIQRNILENPGWYTQYTPYQAEIAQGRLEALLNFQTMVSDLTGMEIANASLLDEATAAAEAMGLSLAASKGKDRLRYFVSIRCHQQTIDVIKTRAEAHGIEVVVGSHENVDLSEGYFGALLQYPTSDGAIIDYRSFCDRAREEDVLVTVAADLLSLAILTPPGEWGADVVVGNSQRFGVPLGYGGPHAAYFATRNEYSRLMPGRIVGVTRDSQGEPALRLALQTREQHIRRDRATSNICTAQVLLAIMASMYAVYHGPEGILRIAGNIFRHTRSLVEGVNRLGLSIATGSVFDTIKVKVPNRKQILERAAEKKINFRIYEDGDIGISLGEPVNSRDVEELLLILSGSEALEFSLDDLYEAADLDVDTDLRRTTPFMEHPVFHSHRSETQLLRYIHQLQQGDLSLTTSMIPLGSCTMKLNATAEMIPITWSSFSDIHPFAPVEQAEGYRLLVEELEQMLAEITGMSAVSLQPNAGSQGEYAGLMAIRAYHESRDQGHRDICLIPTSAHGTNPASAVMAGMKVVSVKCDENGNIDVQDLRSKAEKHQENLAAIMVTYPSTHGVFEESISTICEIVHQYGGQIYMDGANLNALVGICRPGEFGVDVCHLNLHKTFCIPHGGGGPGVGPIAVAPHLIDFLPGHFLFGEEFSHSGPVASAPWGSAGILPISWAYLKLMGSRDLTRATEVAILNANYIARRLEDHYPVLYRGKNGMVAHECILDCRRFRKAVGVSVSDIAKRLMDYGFHAPTISWPVVETMMIEPTESESRDELDRFCEAMIRIREEIDEVGSGIAHRENNVLKNAPHTAEMVCSDHWNHPYTREKAAFPVPRLRKHKFWPTVSRVDDAYGDRNLFCACVPVESYVETADGAAS